MQDIWFYSVTSSSLFQVALILSIFYGRRRIEEIFPKLHVKKEVSRGRSFPKKKCFEEVSDKKWRARNAGKPLKTRFCKLGSRSDVTATYLWFDKIVTTILVLLLFLAYYACQFI